VAGNAVSYGLSWHKALAAITSVPAAVFGYDSQLGSIEPGKQADLVIWSGDPLEVTSFADQVFIAGAAISMESRQTKLRDRYLPENPGKPRAYINP
jgi:imidazolonepropionase-like amidohydrolase